MLLLLCCFCSFCWERKCRKWKRPSRKYMEAPSEVESSTRRGMGNGRQQLDRLCSPEIYFPLPGVRISRSAASKCVRQGKSAIRQWHDGEIVQETKWSSCDRGSYTNERGLVTAVTSEKSLGRDTQWYHDASKHSAGCTPVYTHIYRNKDGNLVKGWIRLQNVFRSGGDSSMELRGTPCNALLYYLDPTSTNMLYLLVASVWLQLPHTEWSSALQ